MKFKDVDDKTLMEIAYGCNLSITQECFSSRDMLNYSGACQELCNRGYKIRGVRKLSFYKKGKRIKLS